MKLDRREFLAGAGGILLLPALSRARLGQESAPPFPIHPRADWGRDLPPKAEMRREKPGDVRYLLVHHAASANEYDVEDVVPTIRTFYGLHTGPERGWPDVAYNFFVDRYGGIWEGRAGSLDGPVIADATGGNQGFDQLCCFIGNHQEAPPTPQALDAMVRLLAWLAGRYGVDPTPGTQVTFISRGSNRWPEGEEVTARTISGHRDMSLTVCPGDYVYQLLEREIPQRVTLLLGAASPSPSEPPSPSVGPSISPTAVPSREPAATRAADTEPTSRNDFLRGFGLAAAAVLAGLGAVGLALGRTLAARQTGRHTRP